MNVLVIGAGALGGLLAALLAERGHRAAAMAREGPVRSVRIEGGGYPPDRTVELPPQAGEPDLVVLAVKTQDLEAAIAQHRSSMGDVAPVVGLQNGLAQDAIIARAVGAERTVPCVVALDAAYLGAGAVRCDRKGTLLLQAGSPAADRAAAILADAVRVERTRNLVGARWTKLLVNLQNVIPALTGLSYQETARHPRLSRAVMRMLREARQVADAEGVTLAPLPWTSPLLLRALSRMPEPLATPLYARRVASVLGKTPAYGSTWQSAQRGQSWETEWLNGEVVRRGAARGVATPVNARAVELAAKRAPLSPEACAAALLDG